MVLEAYPKRYCPVCDHAVRQTFRPGPGGRPDARCPRCRSLERHRFFTMLVDVLRPVVGRVDVLLDIAPTPVMTDILATLEPRRHVRLDLGLDRRLVDVLGDVSRLPFADDCVDLLVCYHVLEHVRDDRAAMRELARVLSPEGIGLVQVPIRYGTVTDEDPDADEADRIARFGQVDHLRFYGDDVEDRFEEAGLSFQRVTPVELLGPALCEWIKLSPAEPVWIVRSGLSRPGVHLESSYLPTMLDRLLTRMAAHHDERDRARQRVQRLLRRAQLEGAESPRRTLGHRLNLR